METAELLAALSEGKDGKSALARLQEAAGVSKDFRYSDEELAGIDAQIEADIKAGKLSEAIWLCDVTAVVLLAEENGIGNAHTYCKKGEGLLSSLRSATQLSDASSLTSVAEAEALHAELADLIDHRINFL